MHAQSRDAVRPLTKRELVMYWLAWPLWSGLVAGFLSIVARWPRPVVLVLAFCLVHPLMSWRAHGRTHQPLGRPFVVDTAAFCLCGALVLLLWNHLGW